MYALTSGFHLLFFLSSRRSGKVCSYPSLGYMFDQYHVYIVLLGFNMTITHINMRDKLLALVVQRQAYKFQYTVRT